MRRLTIAAAATILAGSLFLACGSPSPVPSPRSGAAAAQPGPDRAEALKAVEDLTAAVDEARQAVGSIPSGASPTADERRLRVSDVRRALVAANVALQKSREALSRDDYTTARQATLGMAEHLRDVVAKMKR
jgi:hypothetical protein